MTFLTNNNLWLSIIAIMIIFIIIKKSEKRKKRFKQKQLMSKKEQDFYSLLMASEIATDFNVFPQVSMNAFIDAFEWRDRNYFNQKYVDFLIYDKKSNQIVCVIELDGKEHQKKKDRDLKRDALLEEAGIPTLRYQNNKIPQPEQIKQNIVASIKKEVEK